MFYGVKCDRCGEFHEGEFTYFSDESEAVEQAESDDWRELNGKHYCPNCHSIDEEADEVKPLPPFPHHVKLIRKFIGSIVHSVGESIDESKEGCITLKYSLLYDYLYDHDEAYIRDFLKDSLIDLTQSKEKNHQTKISISIKL